MNFPVNFKHKMADKILTDSNEIGLYNFVESLRTLLIGIQNMNAQDVSVDYYEETNSSLATTQCVAKWLYPSGFQDYNRSRFHKCTLCLSCNDKM